MEKKKSKIVLVFLAISTIALIIAMLIGIIILNKIDNSSIKIMVGHYKMTTLIYEDGKEENVEQLEELGLTVTLELSEDGTGTIDIFGETNKLTYNENNIIVEGETSLYTFENDTITMQQKGVTLILTKINNQ